MNRAFQHSETTLQAIVDLYRQGLTAEQIRRRLCVSQALVNVTIAKRCRD